MRRMGTGDGPFEGLRVTPVEPDPAFRAALRDQLLATAGQPEAPATSRVRRRTQQGSLLTAGAFFATVLMSVHMAICLPQETDRRRSVAQIELPEPAAERVRGAKELGEARKRAGRLIALTSRSQPDPGKLIDAFRQMDGHTRAAAVALTRVYTRTGDRTPLAELVAFSRDQRSRLQPMLAQLPVAALLPAVESMALICGISKQTRPLLVARALPFGM